MLAHFIWLAHRPNLSDRLKWELLQHFGSPDGVYFAEDYEGAGEIRQEAYESLMDKSLQQAESILETCLKEHLRILTIEDPAYPSALRNIFDPPLILYYKGRLPDFNANAVISVVGTRRGTVYGQQAARRLGYQIGKCGSIVVSGLALGIDAMAMEGALLGGSPVAGVLGCGVDVVYPVKNRELYRDTQKYGCLLSELPPGTPAYSWNFPRRNRIISGLADGVLVVEAPRKSGALITARQALEQGRDVYVVPGNIGVDACEGSNQLMQEGAYIATCGWDVVRQYVNLYGDRLREVQSRPEGRESPSLRVAQPVKTPENPEKPPSEMKKKLHSPPAKQEARPAPKEKLGIDNRGKGPYIDINDILIKCNSQEKAIVMLLKNGEAPVDDVIAATGFGTAEVLASITMLEIKGFVTRLPGKRICLKKT